MRCPSCGEQNPVAARFCGNCGVPLQVAPQPQPAAGPLRHPPAAGELAGLGQRAGSWVIDLILQAIPYVGVIPTVINWAMYRRGSTIGLRLVSARIVRDNGELSGFFHTWVRSAAALLSLLPLGLGYWWAFWEPMRQTWHDKLMKTYVVRDSPELAARRGSSATGAVIAFWVVLVSLVAVLTALLIITLVVVARKL